MIAAWILWLASVFGLSGLAAVPMLRRPVMLRSLAGCEVAIMLSANYLLRPPFSIFVAGLAMIAAIVLYGISNLLSKSRK